MRRLLLPLALALSAPAQAEDAETLRLLKDLQARLEKLEARNTELEQALTSERLSQNEPEIATRLKAVEFQALGMQKQARMVDALDGITAGVSFTTVAQRASGAVAPGSARDQLTWRGDAQVSLPGGGSGFTEGNLFFHFRAGQGNGASLNGAFAGTNASAFQLGGVSQADDAAPILAQAWYQLSTPLDDKPLGKSQHHLDVNFGKIDPFLFFDQNGAADDETAKFLNAAFVHNPLLDAGGQAGVDAYGFTPGLRIAYSNTVDGPEPWGVSLGVFGSDSGASFSNSLKSPFVIAQAETTQRIAGFTGNYRLYAWRNGRATHFDGATREAQAGWGLSADQQVADGLTLWGRYGHGVKGHPTFDRAFTLGAELQGDAWGRGADSLGLGLGWLTVSNDNKTANPTLTGSERITELYYRWRVNPKFELSPDYQIVQRPGGAAGSARVLGLRAQATF
ncbi:MAG: carbohydrate porin [Betaproteobacteria bacterium]|nr:carbohydrate porin [Betaproteobacteria bacterium]